MELNPFLVFKFDTTHGLLLSDLFNKRNFKIDTEDIENFFKQLIEVEEGSQIKDNALTESRIFVDHQSPEVIANIASLFWDNFGNSESKLYHAQTYNYPFLDYKQKGSMEIDSSMMGLYEDKWQHPPLYKEYYGDKITLIKPTDYPIIELDSIVNEFKIQPSEKLDVLLSNFIFVSYGKTNTEVEYIRKTAPSGGGKHPTEVYFMFPDDSFVPAGTYHYDVRNHALDLISPGNFSDEFFTATYGCLESNAEKQFSVIYTSFVERAMWRYRDIRSTRAIFADVGHILQGAQWNGWALGLDYGVEYNFRESIIRKMFNLGDEEPILAAHVFHT